MIKTFLKKFKLFCFLDSYKLFQPILSHKIFPKQKYLHYALFFSLCLLFVSCSSVNVQKDLNNQKLSLSNSHTPIAQITTYNYGYKFLSLVPLCGGDPANTGTFTLFRDTVTVENMTDVLIDQSKELGADTILNLTTRTKNMPTFVSLFTCSFVEVQVSGNAVKSN